MMPFKSVRDLAPPTAAEAERLKDTLLPEVPLSRVKRFLAELGRPVPPDAELLNTVLTMSSVRCYIVPDKAEPEGPVD
jgi:hypothetical protein